MRAVAFVFSLFPLPHESNNLVIEHIESSRDEVRGVKALYFVCPTPENIEIIHNDFGSISGGFKDGNCWQKYVQSSRDHSVGLFIAE